MVLYVRSRSIKDGNSFKVSVRQTQRGNLRRCPDGAFNPGEASIFRRLPQSYPHDIQSRLCLWTCLLLSARPDLKESDLAPLQYPEDIELLKEYPLPVVIGRRQFGDLMATAKPISSFDAQIIRLTRTIQRQGALALRCPSGGAAALPFEAPGNVGIFDQMAKRGHRVGG